MVLLQCAGYIKIPSDVKDGKSRWVESKNELMTIVIWSHSLKGWGVTPLSRPVTEPSQLPDPHIDHIRTIMNRNLPITYRIFATRVWPLYSGRDSGLASIQRSSRDATIRIAVPVPFLSGRNGVPVLYRLYSIYNDTVEAIRTGIYRLREMAGVTPW